VPVNVSAAQVKVDAQRQTDVEQARVNVLVQELDAKSKNEGVAVELEKALKRIEADQAIGVAQAQAMGQGLSSANFTIYGSQQMLETILGGFTTGQMLKHVAVGATAGGDQNPINGLLAGAKDLLGQLIPGMKQDGKGGVQLNITAEKLALVRQFAGANPVAKGMIESLFPGILAEGATPAAE
jgi:hypothetical protein